MIPSTKPFFIFLKNASFVMLLFLSIKSHAQHFLFLGKKDLLQKKIVSISNLKNTPNQDCISTSADSCGHIYTLLKGTLAEENWYSTPEEKIENEPLKLVYDYEDSARNYLRSRWGNLESGQARQQYYIHYSYKNKKLVNEVNGSLISYVDTGRENNFALTRYFYFPDGRIKYNTVYDLQESAIEAPGSIDTVEVGRKYYIYRNKQMVGYFPAKDYSSDDLSDSIYSKEKMTDLNLIGFELFSRKYFNKRSVYAKIIEDCYTAVKNEQLLINGQPVKQFLFSIGKNEVDHIIFEIADNYFLFYRITE